MNDAREMKRLVTEYYKELFPSDQSTRGYFLKGCFSPLNAEAQKSLEASYLMEEARRALMGMGLLKAPGPNRYQPFFYKNTWEITGQALYHFGQSILGGEEISPEGAEALLVLIPKEAKPNTPKSFRPISLCNVGEKVVLKMLFNHLKTVGSEILSPNQASFIPGRQITNNIIVCREVIHSLRFMK